MSNLVIFKNPGDLSHLPLAHSGVKCIAFADDVVILASKAFEMKGYLNKLGN